MNIVDASKKLNFIIIDNQTRKFIKIHVTFEPTHFKEQTMEGGIEYSSTIINYYQIIFKEKFSNYICLCIYSVNIQLIQIYLNILK